MEAFVDRIEGEVAVLLIGERQWNLPAALLPAGTGEGDSVELSAKKLKRRPAPAPDIDWKRS
ncbi:MAG TPA: DUF3006 domain-containing protein [Anaeromyxobacteraceae bacterium]|jgi:hypothetical protein|nr:DUF3006 domain-containing protein [Anaeromyxobacteraceae bacterium]